MSVKIIAEIGINHNGDIEICKKLMKVASDAGCNAIKFQKCKWHSPSDVYFAECSEISSTHRTNGLQAEGAREGGRFGIEARER